MEVRNQEVSANIVSSQISYLRCHYLVLIVLLERELHSCSLLLLHLCLKERGVQPTSKNHCVIDSKHGADVLTYFQKI